MSRAYLLSSDEVDENKRHSDLIEQAMVEYENIWVSGGYNPEEDRYDICCTAMSLDEVVSGLEEACNSNNYSRTFVMYAHK